MVQIPKRELARLREIERAAKDYVYERESPAPDMIMRKICFDRLKEACEKREMR